MEPYPTKSEWLKEEEEKLVHGSVIKLSLLINIGKVIGIIYFLYKIYKFYE